MLAGVGVVFLRVRITCSCSTVHRADVAGIDASLTRECPPCVSEAMLDEFTIHLSTDTARLEPPRIAW